jgi:chromosome partitioning protein
MTVTAFAHDAGGTAKTTTAVNLGALLGLAGSRVLIVDMDGRAVASSYLGLPPDARRGAPTVGDLMLDPDLELSDVVVETNTPNVWCIPAARRLDEQLNQLWPKVGGYKRLERVLRRVDGFDHVIIDTRAGVGNESTMALVASDQVIIPTAVGTEDMKGLLAVIGLINQVKDDDKPGLSLAAVVPCNVPPGAHGTVYSAGLETLMTDGMPWSGKVTPRVRHAAAVQESLNFHQPLPLSHPREAVTDDYRKVLNWLTERGVL